MKTTLHSIIPSRPRQRETLNFWVIDTVKRVESGEPL